MSEQDNLSPSPQELTQAIQQTKAVGFSRWIARIFELVKLVIILTMAGYLFHIFVITLFVVDGASMEPNFHDKEYMLVNKIEYKIKKPSRGDVVVFKYPGEIKQKFIKRIIGLPGERVEIKEGGVFIYDKSNPKGFQLKESYVKTPTYTETVSETLFQEVGPDEYFVLGDNRPNSSDSRIWGLLPQKNLIGRAWFIFWPTAEIGLINQPGY